MYEAVQSNAVSRRAVLAGGSAALAALAVRPGFAQSKSNRRVNVNGAAGQKMLESYKKAIRAMLALPPSDPRNWYRIAFVHTLDCPHGNWWFLPWHRAYLGWFEQTCRKLSGDPDFALPYWDWTAEPSVPASMFQDILTPTNPAFISTATEFRTKFEPIISTLDCWKVVMNSDGSFDDRSPYGQLLARGIRNAGDLWFDIFDDPRGKFFFDLAHARGVTADHPEFDANTTKTVSLATLLDSLGPKDFVTFGSPKTLGHGTLTGFGVLEGQPHNNVHNFVGGWSGPINHGGFMQANLSPVDPLFWLHHSNIDRLWDLWTRKQIARRYPYLPDGSPTTPGGAPLPRSDYARWASEPFLFFSDSDGNPVSKTLCGDYAAIDDFNYEYEPGSGEEVVPVTASLVAANQMIKTFSAELSNSSIDASTPVHSSVNVPIEALSNLTAGDNLFARITVAFRGASHAVPLTINVGEEGGAGAPGFAGVLSMFGHHGAHGPVTFLVPISAPARSMNAPSAAGAQNIPLTIAQADGHHAMTSATANEPSAEILSVAVEIH